MPQPGRRRRVPKVVLAAIITTVGSIIVALIGLITVLLQRVPAGPVPVSPSSGSPTLQASVFLSPTAPAKPLPNLYGRKQLLLDDPLVTNTSGRWQVGTSSNKSSCSFRMGGYDVKTTNYHYTCKDMIDTFANFVLQVDMSLSRQSEGRVLFRAAQTGGGYYFDIDDQGNYEIGKNNPVPSLKHVLHQVTPKNTYELTIVANGSSVAIYIDGKPLDHFDDTSYSDGYIALAVDGVAQPNTEVIFTNLKVWQR